MKSVSLRKLAPAARSECTVVPDPSSTLGSYLLPSNPDQANFDNNSTGVSQDPNVDREKSAENLQERRVRITFCVIAKLSFSSKNYRDLHLP